MNIFEINGRKITFHVVGISKEAQEALKFTIEGTGAEIINSEDSTVLFTSAEVLQEIRIPRALIYNINFIIQCVIERQIVDPKPHRLDKRGQEYEYVMRHFLYGTCKKNSATTSQTSSEYATAVTSPANAASTSIPNLVVKQEKIDELVAESMPKCPVISAIKHEETVVSNEPMDCDPSIGEIVCKIERKSDDEVQITAPEDVPQPASETEKSTVVPVKRSTNINRWLTSKSTSRVPSQLVSSVNLNALSNIDKSNKPIKQEIASQSGSTVNSNTLSNIEQSNEPIKQEIASQSGFTVNSNNLSNIEQSNAPIKQEVASPSGSTVNSNTLSNIEQSNEPIRQGSVSPSGCADNLNTLSDTDRSTKRRKQDTSSPFDCTDNLNALPDINQSENPIEKQKDGNQSSSPSSSSSEIMTRSTNIQKKKTRRLFSHKTTIEALSNVNQSDNPIEKQKNGSQSSSSSSGSSEIITKSIRIEKKKTRRMFSPKPIIEDSEEEEPTTISTRDRAGTSGLQNKPAKREDDDVYEVDESSNDSIDHKVPVKKDNERGNGYKVKLWRDTINKKVPREERGKPFEAWERREMINYLVTRRCIHKGKGQLVWSRMIGAGLLTHRSAQSLYNQFRMKILKNIEQAGLSEEVLQEFLKLRKKNRTFL